jgi:geranylgeranyl diphosphate synthase type I
MSAPEFVGRYAGLVHDGLRQAVARIPDQTMRRIASYQLGWCQADGTPAAGAGGKGIRGALALLAAEAVGCEAETGVPGAVAVELVHNFSLLHDDVMDHDVERRHRPTGWVTFGVGPAILAGTAMLTLAAQVVGDAAPHALPCLLDATQQLIGGQSDDLRLESAHAVTMDEVLRMEAGKTAALLRCAATIAPVMERAAPAAVSALAGYGHELGMAFQIVDDVLGIVGDPAATGKSASSDVRARKCSVPIVAALSAGCAASRRLREMFDAAPFADDEEVSVAAKLVGEAGGIDRATELAAQHAARAFACIERSPLRRDCVDELIALGYYVLDRDH